MVLRKKPDTALANRLVQLLEATERALSLSLCFHDFFQRAGLPEYWQWHHGACCTAFRPGHLGECTAFDGDEVHRSLALFPQGRAHRCPFGVREVAVPVVAGGGYVGVLFAGGFAPEETEQRLEDVRLVMQCVAEAVGRLLEDSSLPKRGGEQERQRAIMGWVEENLGCAVDLTDLARRLCLSPSRTAKVVRQMFGKSFTDLVQSTKLDTAAYWLFSTAMPAGEISGRLGFYDQAHFSRLFSRRFGMSPSQYRKQFRAEQNTP